MWVTECALFYLRQFPLEGVIVIFFEGTSENVVVQLMCECKLRRENPSSLLLCSYCSFLLNLICSKLN